MKMFIFTIFKNNLLFNLSLFIQQHFQLTKHIIFNRIQNGVL